MGGDIAGQGRAIEPRHRGEKAGVPRTQQGRASEETGRECVVKNDQIEVGMKLLC